MLTSHAMNDGQGIARVFSLGFPWATQDPFLFCVHHEDFYPEGNDDMGPKASLEGRNLGQDFSIKDGFRMYHGEVIPGFPSHPHRGFETITIARQGLIDHSDSLGASARFGRGDVQWMTAGKGIVHAEMFPLLSKTSPNTAELFQIWLNLPNADKMVDPHFKIFWSEEIPVVQTEDAAGRVSNVTVVAGSFGAGRAPSPPPSSWAARADADVAIFSIKMTPHATLELPAPRNGTVRTLYFFKGSELSVNGRVFSNHAGIDVTGSQALAAGDDGVELLVLSGRPIGEPVVQAGPFVMTTEADIQRAFMDYRRTQFGGWPWKDHGPVHPRQEGRFARHADGKLERPAT